MGTCSKICLPLWGNEGEERNGPSPGQIRVCVGDVVGSIVQFCDEKRLLDSHVSIRPWTLFSRKTSSMWETETDKDGIRVTQVGRDLEGR